MSFRFIAGLLSFGGTAVSVGSDGVVGVGGLVVPCSLTVGVGSTGVVVAVAEVEAIGVSACMVSSVGIVLRIERDKKSGLY